MQNRIILTAAISAWNDGDTHASIVIGGMLGDGTPVEETIAVEVDVAYTGESLRRYAQRALAALVGEL